jgi:hypothetical protein
LVGVAVKVTLVPSQIVLSASDDAIVTLAGRFGFTVVVIALLVAGFPVAHGVILEVRITVTTSPLASVVVV